MGGEYREMLPEQLVTIPRLATRLGVERHTLSRQLQALHRAKGGTWLLRDGRTWKVNLARLEAEHPQRFRPRTIEERVTTLETTTTRELGELDERLTAVERRVNRIA